LLYLSKTSRKGEQLLDVKIWAYAWELDKDRNLTPYQHLQTHAAFAFGVAAGGDVPQVVL
jgi:hypothetical protein